MTGPFDPQSHPGNDPFAAHGDFGRPGAFGAYGQPPMYSGGPTGTPPGPPFPPPRRDRTQWWIAGSAAAVVVVLLLGVLVYKLSSDSGSTTAQSPTSTTVSAPSSSSSATSPPSTSSHAAPQAAPCKGRAAGPGPHTPAGWSTVVSPRGLVYDVPADWTVNECTTLIGWEKKCPDGPFGSCPIRTMSGSAESADPSCKAANFAMTGVPGSKDIADIHQAARSEVGLATDIYSSDGGAAPTVSESQEKSLTVGGSPAVEVVATVTNITPSGCGATRAVHVVVATTVPGQPGTVLFVASLEQGIAGAPGPEVADQLVASLRRVD
jgi:hypothetical protein